MEQYKHIAVGGLVVLAGLAVDVAFAKLVGQASLPALTLIEAPSDAPESVRTSGKFTAQGGRRQEALGSISGISFLSDRTAARPTGISLPFSGQPGFSGIKRVGDGTFLVLSDNGFGNKANSPDAMLTLSSGAPRLADRPRGAPADHFPARSGPGAALPIINEGTTKRYLTGGDLDVESIQPIGESVYFGDEFGPYLIRTDRSGKVIGFWETTLDGKVIKSPDHFR